MASAKKRTEEGKTYSVFEHMVDIFGKALDFMSTHGFKNILLTIISILMAFMLIPAYRLATSRQITDHLIESIVKKVHDENNKVENYKMALRAVASPRISKNLMGLLYQLNADRAFIIEMHNGKENATLLPFVYFDMTYEEVNEGRNIPYIADSFINMNISYFKLPQYLATNVFFIGDKEELFKLDKKFGNRFEETEGEYLGIIMLKSEGVNIGMLGVAFNSKPEISKDLIHAKLYEYVQNLSPLLDLNKLSIDN